MSRAGGDVADRAENLGAPSANGELLFEAPWEGRVLSMAVCLSDTGQLEWERFRAELIREIGVDPDRPYYVQFLNAFQQALVGAGLLHEQEIAERTRQLEQAPHDHD